MEKTTLSKKKVLVIGLGLSGRSAAQFLLAHGAIVHGLDQNIHLLNDNSEIKALQKEGLTLSLEKDCPEITNFDFMVISPGVPTDHFLVSLAKQKGILVIGEIELGCWVTKNPILGITGTNGKTTVTLLVTHVLKHAGFQACALGNVGSPFTRELLKISSQDHIVLELSSYQIETLYQKSLDVALILNITPDHLDRYQTMEAYASAKCQMENCLKNDAHFYIEEKAWHDYGYLLKKTKPRLYGYTKDCYISSDLHYLYSNGNKVFTLPLALKGRKTHELDNFMAAFALCADQGVDKEAFLEAWKCFKKPSHRIEYVTEYLGAKYYDDSKGTNVDAVIRAVQTMDGPTILIAGGVDKGFPYDLWLEAFTDKVKLICAIGQAAAKMHEQLNSKIPVVIFNTLKEAVYAAAQSAQPGDSVLLSPGCASLDMFRDYAHRGEEFQRIVRHMEQFPLTASKEKEAII